MRKRSVGIAFVIAGLVGIGVTASVGAAPGTHGNPTVVQTTNGTVRGASQTGYDEWLGIPYAADPVGNKRWTAPTPAPKWSGVKDTTTFSDRCTQGSGWDPGYENPTLTEDCLSLNVHAPKETQDKRPVLVWIHGGGFTGGAGQDTNPRKFVQQTGAVFVTINYRLGALGFLNLPQPYSDDELELSNQMILYWGRFVASGNPNGARTPQWPKYTVDTDRFMSLSACDTSPASGATPAACSAVTDQFGTEHNTAFWKSLAS